MHNNRLNPRLGKDAKKNLPYRVKLWPVDEFRMRIGLLIKCIAITAFRFEFLIKHKNKKVMQLF